MMANYPSTGSKALYLEKVLDSSLFFTHLFILQNRMKYCSYNMLFSSKMWVFFFWKKSCSGFFQQIFSPSKVILFVVCGSYCLN